MPPDVELTETAIETLRDLDDQHSDRIVSKLEDVVEFPDHYLDPLTNVPGYRLRVGDFRVVVDWDRENGVLYVVAVLERKHDYRELGRIAEKWGAWRG